MRGRGRGPTGAVKHPGSSDNMKFLPCLSLRDKGRPKVTGVQRELDCGGRAERESWHCEKKHRAWGRVRGVG